MGIEPVLEGHRSHAPVLGQLDAPFRQVEVQRLTVFPRAAQRTVGRVERRDDVRDTFRRALRRGAILRGLNLGNIPARHATASGPRKERVIPQRAILGHRHAHRDAGARHLLVQACTDRPTAGRAASARPGRGNRWNCPAFSPRGQARFRGARKWATSAMATQMTWPPGFLRIVVGMGMDGIVTVPRVGRIDGDQRQVPQVGAPGKPRGFCSDRPPR